MVAAIVLWNTVYLERVVQALPDAGNAEANLLSHLSPLRWEYINLPGDYNGATSAATPAVSWVSS